LGSNATLLLQKLYSQTPSGWFIEELGWHEHYTPTTTTVPTHPNPKKHIHKKAMSSMLPQVVSSNFLGSRVLQLHIGGARAFFGSPIVQFLRNQHRNWYFSQPHNQPQEFDHLSIQWLWQPGWKGRRSRRTMTTMTKEGKRKPCNNDDNNEGREKKP
jgi:hypothetical protein